MREIKFRAWTKGTWIYDGMVYDWQDTIFPESVGFQPDDIPIMQYTGLKDKNGEEIYEGDVIEYRFTHKVNIKTNEKIASSGFKRCVVYFENGCFGYKIVKQENSYYSEIPSRFFQLHHIEVGNYFEVIGNIHENPELI